MADNWVIYAVIGVLVVLLLGHIATQWKDQGEQAADVRASIIVLVVVAAATTVWQCMRQ